PVRGDFWQQVLDSGARVPSDTPLDDLTHELFEMLGDTDPHVRDDLAYPVLATWIRDGVYDALLSGLGDGACVGLTSGLGNDHDDSVFRRSLSALVLAEVVSRANATSVISPTKMLTWGDQATTWLTRERDLRGYVPGKGWAHTVAHGADLLGRFARSFHFGVHELTVLLDVVADRVMLPTEYRLQHGEDDRLAYAVMATLHRNLVPTSVLEPWVSRLGSALTEPRGAEEWPSPTAFNTQSFLRALHIQLAAGVRGQDDLPGDQVLFATAPRDRADLILALLEALRGAAPWLYRRPAVPAGS
ncbi:MAG: DUF2785 domain-containing protein, partial [Nocardioidaceae bacterium]